ncbi:Sterigmatocystin 8-O-methyltransferase [Mycena venus]|uniref:Sterigmatocystin 8-O-methyltransferase n=1 Tax=Mycena venus TaxID=2733690 RepID=A0A8H7CVZ1_9AGAR|nr:Sterigmatocystin 8-O-methyltransferase [Mycena venus]
MASEISQLSNIIASSVHDLLELSKANNWSLPALSEPFAPNKNVFRENPEASLATAKIIAASIQLATTLMPPGEVILAFIAPPSKAAAIRVCLECNVPEILREAGQQGLHIMDITQKSGSKIDSDKLSRVMRSLANSHMFREITSQSGCR